MIKFGAKSQTYFITNKKALCEMQRAFLFAKQLVVYRNHPPTLAKIAAKMSETVLITLISGLILGPAVSL